MPKTDVRLAAALAPFAAADGTPWLAVVVGITEPAAALTGAGAVHETMSVTAHAYGPQGTDKGSAGGSLDLTLVPHGGDAIVFESHLQMPLAPGRYTIRIGARNSGGLSGSVYPSVDVPDFIKAPLTLSGIVLASSPAPVAVPRDAFAATLPVRPTARRTFGDIDEAAAFLRIYQARSRPPAAVTLVARVIDDVNTEVASETAALDASAFGDSHQADFHYALPLDKLAPGEYLLRIDATMASEQSDRTLRFTVK
jgi:hypothetical protein